MEWYLMPWKKYADFSGRARRKEYWTFTLINACIGIIIGLIMGAFGDPAATVALIENGSIPPLFIVSWIFGLITFIPNLAVTVRRLHDTDRSGWFILLNLIPIAGLIIFVWMFSDSEVHTNEYGPDPKAEYD